MPDPADTVLLFGITPRSGTNYFYNLMRQHPELDCVTSKEMPEDFLVYHSDLLMRYADLVSSWWTQYWRPGREAHRTAERRAESRAWIARCLGDGLARALAGPEPSGRTVVSKTPTVRNLRNVFELLPDSKVLVLLRDGRDQTASAVRSYGHTHEFAMQRWAEAARTVIAFDDAHRDDDPRRHLLVRYEDLLRDVEGTLRTVFDFLGADPDAFDYSVSDRLPVFGSSQHLEEGENLRQSYRRVERSADFDPRGRWASWPEERLARFNHVAGAEMERLGYELAGPRPSGRLVQRVRDLPFAGRTVALAGLSASERLATTVARYRLKAHRFGVEQ